jgi:pyruvate kinase
MSRIRSDIPIYALTPHATTSRRVTIYRGVYPVPFNAEHAEGGPYRDVFDTLLSRNLAKPGDYVIVTKGDVEGVSGGTNAMTVVQVTEAD